jgi:hypothetical protein
MAAKDAVNRALRRVSGYELRRAGGQPGSGSEERLVRTPVFVMCTVRSGSTLLRVVLNSHSRICAPHELHLPLINVGFTEGYTRLAVRELGLNKAQLEYLLWDRVLDRELRRSGKDVMVDKTPDNALAWRRIVECWPDARFIYLLRHPAAIVSSLQDALADHDVAAVVDEVMPYARGMEEARAARPGLTVRYEDLVAAPERVMREVCAFLGVPWEPQMLDYGMHDHGTYEAGIGDWSDNIRSGRIQLPRAIPDVSAFPPAVADLARDWGY